MLCISHALFRDTLVHFHLNNFVTISIPLVRLSMSSRVNLSSVGLVEETDTWFRMKFSAFHFYNLMIDNWNYAGVQPVQDPGEPSGEMALVNEWMNEWMREERIEADIPWFTQKANKVPDKGLALFTQAAGALLVSWGSEDEECLPVQISEAQAGKWTQRASVLQGISLKKRVRERKKERHGGTRLTWNWSITLFFREAFIPWLVHRGKWKMQSHTESAQTLHLFCLYRNQDFFCIPFP